MVRLYICKCTKDTQHEYGERLAHYALANAFGTDATLLKDERGKPYVHIDSVHVSISHSSERCIVAVSNSEVGVDIEHKNGECERLLKIAERYFTPDEIEYVKESPCENFYRIWCAKESYMKYTGQGFSRPMPSFSVLKSDKCFSHFDIDGYAVCVCADEHTETPPIFVDTEF